MSHSTTGKKKVQFDGTAPADGFNTSKVALTPSVNRLAPAYRVPEERSSQALCVAPPSTISRPNFEDILRRVSIVIHQHIQKCEARFALSTPETKETGMFHQSQLDKFCEENFITPEYVYHFVRTPVSRMGFLYGIHKVNNVAHTPTVQDIHVFLSDLFVKALLSAECSIVCLIYVERLMENAFVPVLSRSWRPILLCGLLLASKVWQDLSSWNSEFSQIYPQFSLKAINKLEVVYCKEIKWNLYISSSTYAKYYFALRSLTEKTDFRRNYNVMVVNAPGAEHIAERSGEVRQQVLNKNTLSRSL
ncbi:hypothetical protein B484DRAFT_352358 [Ochromonadaceae sp. CCMP2298]|nr:hypothetical protein B484DRAFT_352358 [Ochromonadaceae sp. CCMP2298]|mmetsp:Transcript_22764/g.50635  ORF Transcript_22764/g.50635 Transcript_22764/m.50635 type:complete len:305 (+) Transcript_22764:93-1007(+)|eukprot:CAMPEP_0173195294 /NCGR_PEP_ID=MMETSP1141-20130122/14972_1 /TAXON_ID=483371 /ORGANISM="non described non described, Strain CCMP2298" /LENGTH=304 /DNA_ID=CAMNT_0014119801 /DNA_START=9 /DNA_END=923 /DNA_ORIENTATION=+